MKRTLIFLALTILMISISIAGSSKNEQPESNLVFSHDHYKLENFSFISRDYSVGLVIPTFQKRTLVILYNKENLIVDSIFTDWTIEKIIPSTDSSFFLLSENQTINCIIRNNEMLINGIYAGNTSKAGYEKLAYYSLPFSQGEFQVLKKSERKNEFTLQVSNGDLEPKLYPFDQRKKNIDIDLFATQKSIFVYLPTEQKLLQMNKNECEFDEIKLSNDKGSWLFYHDYIMDQSYLLNDSKAYRKLYALSSGSDINYIKDLDFIPEAIFDGSLHKKSEKGKNYSHYLIPLDSKDKEKTIHLKSVIISTE